MLMTAAESISLTAALSNLSDIVTTCIGWIEQNAVLMTIFVAGLIPAGFMVIRKAKKASKA